MSNDKPESHTHTWFMFSQLIFPESLQVNPVSKSKLLGIAMAVVVLLSTFYITTYHSSSSFSIIKTAFGAPTLLA